MTTARILVVDDEPQIRRVMRMTLSAEGYEVYEARTGEKALEELRAHRFDLVLLDMNLPGAGGLEICRAMRANSDIAVVMLTVRNTEEDKVAALDAGADDYITKPFSTPELLARIRASLRRVPLTLESSSGRIAVGDLEMNVAGRRLTVQGKEVRLTPKEYEVLLYLMSNPDTSIPHGKLLQAVWGPDYGGETEYLRTFVNRLRKKLEPDPAKPRYIVTEPWVGYRFQTS
ncbi:MAG: response regulator transcription factor [Bryobacteraceae bacterium]|nr:response regulator transcription factor [Bryobacteraceae bacterium]